MNTAKNPGPATAIIVGAGHRSMAYASYALMHPDELKIVGVVDPSEHRRKRAAEIHEISEENCFSTVDEFVSRPKTADATINGTMDKLHVATSLPLLELGYDLLLEKPIATNEADLLKLLAAARKSERKVMICHVLRYAPFYVEIKKRVAAGEIGEILNIQTAEHVSYHHMSVAYVRGKWNSKKVCGSSMLMAKCCHDLDIITWMKSGSAPVKVSSFGGLKYFRSEKAPKGSGTRCLVDCPIEKDCIYSAKKIYLDQGDRWSFYVWTFIEGIKNPTYDDKLKSLCTDNPHGRCIWKCDNDVVDHQSVAIEFEDGTTATHNMVGGTSRPDRKIHILGTAGEIEGYMSEGIFVVRHPDTRTGHEYTEEKVSVSVMNDAHGGGDLKLVEDFVRVIRGQKPSISTTNLADSIYGHLIGFGAGRSVEEKRTIDLAL